MAEALPPIPGHERCFVCGSDNPHGLRLSFSWTGAETNVEVLPAPCAVGFSGYLHGAVTGAILDEAQERAVWAAGMEAVTTEHSIRYLLPIPMGERLEVSARIVDSAGGSYCTEAELRLADGRVAATSTSVLVRQRRQI